MVLKLAWRELKNNSRFSIFYAINFAIGLIGLLLLFSFKSSLNNSIQERSREILTADFSVHARRPILDEEIQNIEALFPTQTFQSQQQVSLYTMAYNDSSLAKLIQVRGIEKSYPFWGDMTFKDNEHLSPSIREELQSCQCVWAYEETAQQFDLEIGDQITFGEKKFTVTKIITDDTSDTSMGFSLAPRIYVGLDNLKKTNLIAQKSTLFDTRYYKFDSDVELSALKTTLNEKVEDTTIRFSDPETAASRSVRFFAVVNDYLSLVALVAFFLASLGVNYLIQNYIEKKKYSVAILKTLGLSSREIQKIYLVQLFLLSVLAWLLSSTLLIFLHSILTQLIPGDFTFDLSWMPFILGFLLASIASLLISLPFLQQLNLTHPALLLKSLENHNFPRVKLLLYYTPIFIFFMLLSFYLGHSFRLGGIFFICLLVSFFLFRWASFAFLKLINKKKTFSTVYLKLFARSAARNSSQFSSAVTALGLGVLLFNLLPTIESSLRQELSAPEKSRVPSLFLVDIDEDELGEIGGYLESLDAPLKNVSPMIRAKLMSINGVKFEKSQQDYSFGTREQERESWARNRGFNLTYPMDVHWRDYEIVKGSNFSGPYNLNDLSKSIEVVIEQRFADRLNIQVGDILNFDIQGVEINTKIVGMRKITWTSFRPNFFVSLQPNSMVDAPKSFIGVTEKMDEAKRSDVIVNLAKKFPNVSVIDVTRNVEKLLVLIHFLGRIFQSLSILSIFTGLVIISSLANYEAYKRIKEINLLKILGLGEAGLHKLNLLHYGILALISSFIGSCFSLAMSYVLIINFFEGIWVVQYENYLFSIFMVILLTQLVSWLSIRRIFKKSSVVLLEAL